MKWIDGADSVTEEVFSLEAGLENEYFLTTLLDF